MSTTKRGKSSKGTAANQETGSGNKYRDFNNTAFDSLTNDVKKLKQNLKELDDKIEDSKIDNLNENGEFHTDLKRRLRQMENKVLADIMAQTSRQNMNLLEDPSFKEALKSMLEEMLQSMSGGTFGDSASRFEAQGRFHNEEEVDEPRNKLTFQT